MASKLTPPKANNEPLSPLMATSDLAADAGAMAAEMGAKAQVIMSKAGAMAAAGVGVAQDAVGAIPSLPRSETHTRCCLARLDRWNSQRSGCQSCT